MNGITIHEYDTLVAGEPKAGGKTIPCEVFAWLEDCCLAATAQQQTNWLKLTKSHGRRGIQATGFVGTIRAPGGFQIEILPKVGRASAKAPEDTRQLLMEMLACTQWLRHIRTDNARLSARKRPLLDVFIGEFLQAVGLLVKRGIRSDYVLQRGQLPALRGKLATAHFARNLLRPDRFLVDHDEYCPDRPENRLLRTALGRALAITGSHTHQALARELCLNFSDIPESRDIPGDMRRIRIDRGMEYYNDALAWARLLLQDLAPDTEFGKLSAPSLLFPMERVFEEFVATHLRRQLADDARLHTQARSEYLVRHQDSPWFQLKPDLLVREDGRNRLVLDTKWKLLDSAKSDSRDKYGLSSADFYQLFAYGQNYLRGVGDIVLIYPKTDPFPQPLPVFLFPNASELRLWVLPFCLKTRTLQLPDDEKLCRFFRCAGSWMAQPAAQDVAHGMISNPGSPA